MLLMNVVHLIRNFVKKRKKNQIFYLGNVMPFDFLFI